MTDYCQNLWSKLTELRAAQTQAEADFRVAGREGDLKRANLVIDSLNLDLNQMLAEWDNSLETLPDGQKLFGPEFETISRICKELDIAWETAFIDWRKSFGVHAKIEDGRIIDINFNGELLTEAQKNYGLESIALFPKLKGLTVHRNNKIQDLSRLRNLKDLKEIRLSEMSNLQNIDTIRELKPETLLITKCGNLFDLSPLSELRNVKYMYLSHIGGNRAYIIPRSITFASRGDFFITREFWNSANIDYLNDLQSRGVYVKVLRENS